MINNSTPVVLFNTFQNMKFKTKGLLYNKTQNHRNKCKILFIHELKLKTTA